nr:RHS repeat-associated core domain-containing protein [Sinomicrobium weinanense]
MPGRKLTDAEGYRYGYQGEFAETDVETGKPVFELRLYDPRINRWLSPDPMGEFYSPYLAMGNNWGSTTDPTGGMTDCEGCPTIKLDEVVVYGNAKNFGERFNPGWDSFPQWLLNADWGRWSSSFKGNLEDYNRAWGTRYTSHNEAYGDWVYAFTYLPEHLDHIRAIHTATGEAAQVIFDVGTIVAGGVALKGAGLAFRGSNLLSMSMKGAGRRMLTEGVTEIIGNRGNLGNVNLIGIGASAFGSNILARGAGAKFSYSFNEGFVSYNLDRTVVNFAVGSANAKIHSVTKLGGSFPFNSGFGKAYLPALSIAGQSGLKLIGNQF